MDITAAKLRILAHTPLIKLISESVKLETRSGRPVGICPFHEEKSGSFTVFDDHYHCFGCHAHGDAISFVREKLGLSFRDALKHLATKYDIAAPELEQSQAAAKHAKKAAQQYDLLAQSTQYFQSLLHSQEGEAARHYLHQRGYDDNAIQEFGFGLSPSGGKTLLHHFQSMGISTPQLLEASLATTTKQGSYYDFFQNRLMIPISDAQGRVIAFGGRALDDTPPKYKNSRDTSLFDKGRVLFGLSTARSAIRKKQRTLVTEGYMDTIALWQNGFQETVACLGTALSVAHLQQLSHIAKTIYLVFDGDKAGQTASLRTVELALQVPELAVKVCRLPPEHDPDSFVRSESASALQELLATAPDLLSYAVEQKLSQSHALGIPHLIETELLPWLEQIKNPLQRSYLFSKLTTLTGVSLKDLQQSLSRPQSKPQIKAEPTAPKMLALPDKLSIELIGHIYHAEPAELEESVIKSLTNQLELDPFWLEAIDTMISWAHTEESPPSDRPKEHWPFCAEPSALSLIQDLENRSHCFTLTGTKTRSKAFTNLANRLQMRQLQKTSKELKTQLIRHNQGHPLANPRQVLQTVAEISQKIAQLNQQISGAGSQRGNI